MPGPLAPDGSRRLSTRIWVVVAGLFIAAMAVVAAGAFLGRDMLASPAAILGQPVRAASSAGDRVFVVTQQWKVYSGGWGRGPERPTFAGPVTDVWAFDADSMQPVWRRRMALERSGVYSGRSILGVDGDILWVLHPSGVLGLSVADGEVRADTKRIERANPDLRGRLSTDPGAYQFDAAGLSLATTSGSRLRLRRDLTAKPDASPPPSPLPGVIEPARIALGPGTSAFAPPIQLTKPDSVLALHRERLGAAGQLRLSRTATATGEVLWTADLPIQRLEAVMPGQAVLVLYGHREELAPRRLPTDRSQAHVDHLVAVDLKTGAVSGYGLKMKVTAAGDLPPSASLTPPAQEHPAP